MSTASVAEAPRRPWIGGCLTAGAALLAAGPGSVAAAVVAGGTVAALLVGERKRRRGRVGVRPGRLVGLALVGLALSAVATDTAGGGWQEVGQIGGLVSLAVALIALWTLLAARVRDRALDMMLEALLIALSAAVIVFIVGLEPDMAGSGSVQPDAVVFLVRGAFALVAVVATVRLVLLSVRERVPARRLFAGVLLIAAGEAIYTASRLGLHVGDRVALAAQLAGVAVAALALAHPLLGAEPPYVRVLPTRMGTGRVLVVIVAVLLVPGLAAWKVVAGEQVSTGSVTFCSALLSLAVVAHLGALLAEWARVEQRSHHDELTGLANRSSFQHQLDRAVADADRDGSQVAVMFCDLDRFKVVNDSLGHAAGNQLLQAVATRLTEHAPDDAVVSRVQGDEFALLLPEVDGPEEGLAVARRLVAALAEPYVIGRRKLWVSASIGVARFPTDGSDPESLLRSADRAMYKAKQLGRNNAQLHTDDLRTHSRGRFDVESALHGAIERGELRLLYQPRVELSDGRLVGAEALVRWEHAQLGTIGPDRFIPVAEESGHIVQLGEWVLETACTQLRRWQDAAFPDLTISVNLSARQFALQPVSDLVARVLRRTGADPRWLELELTESLALQDPELVTAALRDLRDMGVRCSIDDFGTGYSGLSYLSRFPVNALKIDKSFVQGIDAQPGDQSAIVLAIIALAKGLKLRTIAEGVETNEQLYFLLRNGCDEIQGYLFSPPVPADRFEELVMLERVAAGPGRLAAVHR